MKTIIAILFRAATTFRTAPLPTAPRAMLAATWLAVACGLGGCASGGAGNNSFAMAGGGAGGTTVAFESIDGPPPQVFDRMVNVLDSESKLRNLSIVSREAAASYRVRSYLSAQVIRGRTTIAWVWDVYDRDQQRALLVAVIDVPDPCDRGAAADDLGRKITPHPVGGRGFAGDDRKVAELRFAVEHIDHAVEHLRRGAVDRFKGDGCAAGAAAGHGE